MSYTKSSTGVRRAARKTGVAVAVGKSLPRTFVKKGVTITRRAFKYR